MAYRCIFGAVRYANGAPYTILDAFDEIYEYDTVHITPDNLEDSSLAGEMFDPQLVGA